jgi:hypothetical protein
MKSGRAIVVVLVLASLLAPAAAGKTTPIVDAELYMAEYGLAYADAVAQAEMREAMNAAIDTINAHPDQFAGAYVTHHAGIRLHVMVADSWTASVALIEAATPDGTPVAYVPARYSSRDLRAVQEQLIGTHAQFEAAGVRLVSVGRDVENNRVVLSLNGGSTSLRENLADRYGPAVTVLEASPLDLAACTSISNCTPWRGGIKIRPADGTGLECTYGYTARRKTQAQLHMITAGHCDQTETETWTHNGYTIGTTQLNNTLFNNGLGDAMRVPRSNSSTPLNRVYQYDFYNSYPINDVRTYGQQIEGDPTWLTGFTSGTKSGTIIDDDYYFCISFRGVTRCGSGKKVDELMTGGDSGGPTYSNYKGNGIISAVSSSGGFTAYSTLELIETALDVWICTTSSC